MPLIPSGLATNPNLLYRPTTFGSAYKETIVMSSFTNLAVRRSTRPLPSPLRCHAGLTCTDVLQESKSKRFGQHGLGSCGASEATPALRAKAAVWSTKHSLDEMHCATNNRTLRSFQKALPTAWVCCIPHTLVLSSQDV